MDFDRDRPCVWKVHVSHVAKDKSGKLVGLVEVACDRGGPAFWFVEAGHGVPRLHLEKQV